MQQKIVKEGKQIPPTPGFELQVTQCLVRATLTVVLHMEGWISFLKPKLFIVLVLYSASLQQNVLQP